MESIHLDTLKKKRNLEFFFTPYSIHTSVTDLNVGAKDKSWRGEPHPVQTLIRKIIRGGDISNSCDL